MAMENAKNYLTTAASVAASAMLARTVINEFLPYELRNLATSCMEKIFGRYSTEHTILIRQTEGLCSNELYHAAQTYLRTKISPTIKRLRASKSEDKTNIVISLDDGDGLTDTFEGVEFWWQLISEQESQSNFRNGLETNIEVRRLELRFHEKYKELALNTYFPHILERSKEINAADRRLKLYMNEYDCWSSIDLNHPATLETLALETDLKRTVVEDLARFVKRKDYYKRIGKAWKRGYLLFGPPGTGKSSLVAAIANYLRFDIYDMDLKQVNSNAGLKKLLIGMANKSMLVIEDIDCSIDLRNRDEENVQETYSHLGNDVTLSGLLNFVDGLWSTSGEERIIVFTTNYKDRLDPALLRPGRMDMHIHMGYCGSRSFRILASNYHAISEHPLFDEIDRLMDEVDVTPAEVAEEMIRSDDVDIILTSLIQLLEHKKLEKAEEDAKSKKKEEDIEQKNKEKPNDYNSDEQLKDEDNEQKDAEKSDQSENQVNDNNSNERRKDEDIEQREAEKERSNNVMNDNNSDERRDV